MGTTKAVIDTNVIISAFKWGGKPWKVFEQLLSEDYEFIISDKQLLELKRVAQYPHLNLLLTDVEELLYFVSHTFTLVRLNQNIDVVKEDPSDNIIITTAVEHNAAFIITGDNHLLKLKQYGNVKIMTPAEFLKIHNA